MIRFGALVFVSVGLLAASCSSGTQTSGFGSSSGGSSGASSGGASSSGTSSGGASSSSGGASSSSGTVVFTQDDGGGSSSGTTGTCVVTNADDDMDKDGWTPNQGDCNDCDPNVNPGAIDVLHQVDGGTPYWGDEDCSGVAGDSAKPCDTGLALTDVDPNDGAKSIELCQTATTSDRKYGVLSATYVRANGTAIATPGAEVGIQPGWGTSVHVQGGASLLALSSGYARSVGQTGACNGISCTVFGSGTAPTGFPQDDPACPPTPAIFDDVALEVQVRVPTNATGYSFNFKFYSFEFPNYVCDPSGYNDQFIALVTPPPTGAYVPTGSTGGNISFDSNNNPVSVNLGYFDVCDGVTSRFAKSCNAKTGATCPALPSPYCPLGVGDLAGTGFDAWDTKDGPAGATRWLQTQAPATPGSVITIRFAIWDAGNGEYDSTVLIDNFAWIASGGVTTVVTQPQPQPK